MNLETVLWIIAALAAAAFIKWGIPYIKSKVDIEKLNKVLAEVKDLVELAEKLFGTGNNETKLDYVFNELKKMNFAFSDDALISFIKEAFDTLYARLASENIEVPTNKASLKEYEDIKNGKENKDFESSVLAASYANFNDFIKQPTKTVKKTTKKDKKEDK